MRRDYVTVGRAFESALAFWFFCCLSSMAKSIGIKTKEQYKYNSQYKSLNLHYPPLLEPMKTTILLFTILTTNFTLSSQSTININFVGLELVYNNHVGNEWYEEVKVSCGGREYTLREGDSVDIKINPGISTLYLETYIQETDTYPDIATERKIVNLSEIDNYQLIEIENIVREGHGRYAGNTAKWKFKVLLTR